METRLGIVTGRKSAKNRGGGPVTRLLQAMVTDRQDVQTVQLVEQMGEESNPPNGCLVVILPGGQAFKLGAAAGDGIAPVMDVGGKRIYSIDPATNQEACQVRLDPDGTITLVGPVATQTIAPDGTVTIDNGGVTQTLQPDGTVATDNGAASFTMNPDGTFLFVGTASTFDHPVAAQSFAATVAGGTGTVQATNVEVTGGDVTSDGISLENHVHPENDNGGPTGAPQ